MSEVVFQAKLPTGFYTVFNDKPELDTLRVKQIHSNIIALQSECQISLTIEADGILGDFTKPMAILTADCVPVIIFGKEKMVAIHAGWRGLSEGILHNPLIKEISPYFAFIGPHIRQEAYEVQEDFVNNFPNHPKAFKKVGNKLFFNLSYVCQQELASHYAGIEIEDCLECTFQDHKYNSYRRDKTTKRNWNVFHP